MHNNQNITIKLVPELKQRRSEQNTRNKSMINCLKCLASCFDNFSRCFQGFINCWMKCLKCLMNEESWDDHGHHGPAESLTERFAACSSISIIFVSGPCAFVTLVAGLVWISRDGRADASKIVTIISASLSIIFFLLPFIICCSYKLVSSGAISSIPLRLDNNAAAIWKKKDELEITQVLSEYQKVSNQQRTYADQFDV